MASKKPGGKHKKHGRNAKWCQAYRNSQRREVNKAKKLLRTLYRVEDNCAKASLKKLPQSAVKIARREGEKVRAKWAELKVEGVI